MRKNSAILRAAALGPAPLGTYIDGHPEAQYASAWVNGPALAATLSLFPSSRSVGHRAFGGMTEQEARLALLLVAASEELEGR